MPACKEHIVSDAYEDEIVGYFGQESLLSGLDCVEKIDENFAVVYERREDRPERDISFSVPLLFGPLQEALEGSGVNRVRRIAGFDYRGSGILLGFVDTGVDYRHPAFLYEDGRSRVEAIWDQADQTGQPPEGFAYGTEFTAEDIAAELAPKDEDGHGTFLAGVAAGRPSPEDGFYGVAPLSGIVMVKLKPAKAYLKDYYCMPENVTAFSEADMMFGVKYLVEYAKRQEKPMVICIGMGSGLGSHRGSIPLSRYLNSLAYRPDICIISAAGNEGNARHHASLQAGEEQSEMELYVAERGSGFTLDVFSEALGGLSLKVSSPAGEESPELSRAGGDRFTTPFLLDRTMLHVERESLTRTDTLQQLRLRFRTPAPGIWRLLFTSERAVEVDAWLPMREFLDTESYFLVPEPGVTLCEPANAPLLFTTGGYSVENGSLAPFSSRGFTGNGQKQPTILAPAVDMTGPFAGGGYITRSGTSAGAAFAAGCVALYMEYILEYRRNSGTVTPIDTVLLRNLFSLGASREENTRYPSPVYGYGKLNLYGVFEFLRNL